MTPKERAADMWSCIKGYPNCRVAWYLSTSWLYYKQDISLLPDEDYDQLCKQLLRDWDSIEHPHKQYVDYEGLRAGTGFALKVYPGIVMSAASRLAEEDGHLTWNPKTRTLEKST